LPEFSICSNITQVQQVGYLTQKTIDILGLNRRLAPCDILIGPTNISHMRIEHESVFRQFFDQIPDVLEKPDYIGHHPDDESLQFMRVLPSGAILIVAVRMSKKGNIFVRSITELVIECE